MKTKLIKINDIYTLLGEDNKMIASDDIDFQSDYKIGKLSKKNCDEIFGVVDVDKLTNDLPYAMGVTRKDQKQIWMDGFNKAMELNKYTEEDIMKAYDFGSNALLGVSKNNLIQSLQQPTEIEVEIEMEYVGECNGNNGDGCFQDSPGYNCGCFEYIPKLDKDGCLILKKI